MSLTHLGETVAAQQAQQDALALYPERDFLDRALVRLDRAACLSHDRQPEQAMQVASAVLLSLDDEQRRGLVTLRGREVLQSLPRAQRALPAAREFQELLMLTKGEA